MRAPISCNSPRPPHTRVLKHDALGVVRLLHDGDRTIVARDTRGARPWARWLARRLARREARALRALAAVAETPQLIGFDGQVLWRSYVPGEPLHAARSANPAFFREALRLLRRVHRAGVAHNDLAKEPNWLCAEGAKAAIVDFQLAYVSPGRDGLFRLLAREDLRHLLKHKRCYMPHLLTARQRALLAAPSLGARAWRALVKPPYRLVTRGLLGWHDRQGPAERES